MKLITVLGILLAGSACAADSAPLGRWKTVDDKTGNPRAIVLLYEQDGKLFGKVEASLNPNNAGKRCDKCADDRKGQPVVGMVILRGMKRKGNEYSGGDILDPDTGSIYRCKLRVIDDGRKLSVRGYMGISLLGRSQTWHRDQ
jgi:uncharacterized protein (DUF2147 family)